MNNLNREKRKQVVSALVEGASINSIVRMTGLSKPTILKLLADLGTACANYQDENLRNLPCKRVQCDEIWSFCFAKVRICRMSYEENLDSEAYGPGRLCARYKMEAGITDHVWELSEIIEFL